jgi:uncharacterized protein (TIGR00725 family)
MRISVIGGGRVDEATYERARAVGRVCGERGYTVVCGGYGGVMEAACRGGKEAGGDTVGILKGTDPDAANDWVDTPVVTELGNGRNVLVVLNGDGVVAVDGATGTLSELALALDYGKPVAGLDTHDLSDFAGFEAAESPVAAVDSVERRA